VQALGEGDDPVELTYTVRVADEYGAYVDTDVTITITGTNDAPVAVSETVTKVADHESSTRTDYIDMTATALNGSLTMVQGYYGVDSGGDDQNAQKLVDSKGNVSEGISFTIDGTTTAVSMLFAHLNANDNVSIELYLDGTFVGNVSSSTIPLNGNNKGLLNISGDVVFDEVRVWALDIPDSNVETEFKIEVGSVKAAIIVETDILTPFVVDDATLLANDADVDGELVHVELTDGILYGDDGITAIGTVSIINDGGSNDGDIQVIPMEEYVVDADSIVTFNYVVVDEFGAQSEVATATVDVALHTVEGTYTNGVNNALIVDGTLDLSNVSNIEVLQLDNDSSTVKGSSLNGAINAQDVFDVSDSGQLIIHSTGEGGATDQVNVDTSTFDHPPTEQTINGVDYLTYTSDMATLLIEIEPSIVTEDGLA
jgi:hypothetical protein